MRIATWRAAHASWEEEFQNEPAEAEVEAEGPVDEVPAPVVPVVAAAAMVAVVHAAQPRDRVEEDSESEVEDEGGHDADDLAIVADEMDLDDFDEEEFDRALAEFEAVFR